MTEITKSKDRRKGKVTYGMLYAGDHNFLNYLDLGEKETYFLADFDGSIESILIKGEEIYFGDDKGIVRSLFGKFESKSRDGGMRISEVESIQKHGKRILDAGCYGLFDTLENKMLISPREFTRRNISSMPCMSADRQGNLYGLAFEPTESRCVLVEIDEDREGYFLREKILSYGQDYKMYGQVVIIPYGSFRSNNGDEYPFSIVGCANLKYLDLNGEKIEGTEAKGNEEIFAVKPLNLRGDGLEVVYSGRFPEGIIIKARIDLRGRKVIGKETYGGGCFNNIYALELVTRKALHRKLIKKSELIT